MPEQAIGSVIESYAAAWQRGDLAAIVALYHDDFTLNYYGRSSLAGRHVGKAAALQALAAFSTRTQRALLEIVAIMAGPTRGAVIAREALGIGDARIEVERVLVYTVADGQLSECWVYDADQDAIDTLIGTD